jgi:hypothetical protein
MGGGMDVFWNDPIWIPQLIRGNFNFYIFKVLNEGCMCQSMANLRKLENHYPAFIQPAPDCFVFNHVSI